jgi:hypothetical protein
VIDDTVVFRCSKKAPESRIHHQHGQKANRPIYVRGQNWASLALTVSQGWRSLAIPVLSRLSRTTGNSGKLVAVKTLLKVVQPFFQGHIATLLVDCWYMRKTLLLPAQQMGYQVIGQVRKDTELYLSPPAHNSKRGRPRKHGDKLTPEKVAGLPMVSQKLFLYGRWQTLHYRSTEALASFLGGQPLRAVWTQMKQSNGSLCQPRLFLCTAGHKSSPPVMRCPSCWPYREVIRCKNWLTYLLGAPSNRSQPVGYDKGWQGIFGMLTFAATGSRSRENSSHKEAPKVLFDLQVNAKPLSFGSIQQSKTAHLSLHCQVLGKV